MVIEFPSEIDEINSTDFDILRTLHIYDSLWKMELTRKMNSRRENDDIAINLKNSISKQAVSKRVNRLHELGYLEKKIMSTENKNLGFIIGYTNSEKGKQKLCKCLRLIFAKCLTNRLVGNKSSEETDDLDNLLKIYSELIDQEVKNLEEFVVLELN